MGCDIHVFLEFWHKEKGCWISIYPDRPPKDVSEEESWKRRDWGKYTSFPSEVEDLAWSHTAPRNRPEPYAAPYWYFGRNYEAFGYLAGVRGDGPVFEEAKGIPEDASAGVKREFWLRVVETEENEGGGAVTRERAEGWVSHGESWVELDGVQYVTHPDWHSATYYTLKELNAHLQGQNPDNEVPKRIFELRDEMVKMSDRYVVSSHEIRVCFWFDN